eukprot:193073-Prorocentrum_minimum.AAC.1
MRISVAHQAAKCRRWSARLRQQVYCARDGGLGGSAPHSTTREGSGREQNDQSCEGLISEEETLSILDHVEAIPVRNILGTSIRLM